MADEMYAQPDLDPADVWLPQDDSGYQAMPAYWGDDTIQPLPDEPAFGEIDYGASVLLVDSDYSGSWNHAVIDVDGNGAPELLASVQGDGIALVFDLDGDGLFDHTELVTPEQLTSIDPALAELLDVGLTMTPPDDATFTPVQIDYEEMTQESPYWFEQAADGLCVPASVAQIVAEYTGMTFENEAEFVDLANEYGLLMVDSEGIAGMTVEGSLFLMEQAGVPASLVISANIDMLDSYLDSGHGVVLFVNSSEVWYGEDGSGTADHALVLTDIDHDAGVAILSDPGHPEGNGFTVSLDVLEEAWAAGDNTMLIAEDPAPGALTGEPAAVTTGDPIVKDVGLGAGFTPQEGGDSLDGIELHTRIPAAMQWLVARPWVLLPVAIGASRLIAR